MKGVLWKILLVVCPMLCCSQLLFGQINSWQSSGQEKTGVYACNLTSYFDSNRDENRKTPGEKSVLFSNLEMSNDSSIVDESSRKSISFDNAFSGITVKGIHFVAYGFSLSRTKYLRRKKLAFQTGLSVGIASNIDSSVVYDPILANNVETIEDRNLIHLDFRSEIKYNLHRSFKKDRFVSFGIIYGTDFVSERISREAGSGVSVYSSASENLMITPLLSYSKEKHFNARWSFNTSIGFGRNIAENSNFYYVGCGFRHRSKNPDENLFRSRSRY